MDQCLTDLWHSTQTKLHECNCSKASMTNSISLKSQEDCGQIGLVKPYLNQYTITLLSSTFCFLALTPTLRVGTCGIRPCLLPFRQTWKWQWLISPHILNHREQLLPSVVRGNPSVPFLPSFISHCKWMCVLPCHLIFIHHRSSCCCTLKDCLCPVFPTCPL